MTEKYVQRFHQGIRIDSIPASGFAGLLFTIATVIVFLGVPAVREFFLVGLAGGAIVAAGLYFWHNQTRW